jgi:hypothetical protein
METNHKSLSLHFRVVTPYLTRFSCETLSLRENTPRQQKIDLRDFLPLAAKGSQAVIPIIVYTVKKGYRFSVSSRDDTSPTLPGRE